MGWVETRDAVISEIDALVTTARGLSPDQWNAPTTCAGWTAGDAAAHVAGSIDVQQTAFQNMLAGRQETPEWIEPPHISPEATLDGLARGQAKAIHTMGRLTAEHADEPVPLPFGTFPCPAALDIILLEYGTHRWDIANAAGDGARLSMAASDCVLRLMPAFLTFFAAAPPAAPIGYRLQAESANVDASVRDGAWTLEPSDVPTTIVLGDDSAVALFALGRIAADDPRLAVEGADGPSFKRWFPGP
jgi:uncharacterized protein (TIGR03083 family)